MDKKHDFTGIIITVVIAVILMSVIPIYNNMTSECPPCEEVPSYNIGDIVVNPDFSSGNYNVDKGSYDYLDDVTIIKDENLIPENIKKDVNIFGIIGTYEESGEGLPIDFTGYGLVILTGEHTNNTIADIDMSDPIEGYLVCNDGTDDVDINGQLLYYWGSNHSEKDQGSQIAYTFLFKIPAGFSIKEFWLKSNVQWDRDYAYAVINYEGETIMTMYNDMDTQEGDIDIGYTTQNQFTRIFSLSNPTNPSRDTEDRNGPSIFTINLATYKD